MTSILEQVEYISKDILQKISEVKEGSNAHKFLLIKKRHLMILFRKLLMRLKLINMNMNCIVYLKNVKVFAIKLK